MDNSPEDRGSGIFLVIFLVANSRAMQSYYWWFKYVPPGLRRVFVKGEPGELAWVDPVERRLILAAALPVAVSVGLLVWIDAREKSYERFGRLLSPERGPIDNEAVLYACLSSLALLVLPALVSMIASIARRHALAFRAAIVALVLSIAMLFLDFLMLLSDTKGFSGLGTWASIFSTVHGAYFIMIVLQARASRAVVIWTDSDT
jgi:hypothetical protein